MVAITQDSKYNSMISMIVPITPKIGEIFIISKKKPKIQKIYPKIVV